MDKPLAGALAAFVLLFPRAGRPDVVDLQSQTGGGFEIRGNGDLCLDVRGGVAAAGTAVIVYHCHGGQNQRWQPSGASLTGLGGLCLDVQGGQTADRTPIIVWTCHGGPNQEFELMPNGTIHGYGSKCLDTMTGAPRDDEPVVLNHCSGQPSQRWRFVARAP